MYWTIFPSPHNPPTIWLQQFPRKWSTEWGSPALALKDLFGPSALASKDCLGDRIRLVQGSCKCEEFNHSRSAILTYVIRTLVVPIVHSRPQLFSLETARRAYPDLIPEHMTLVRVSFTAEQDYRLILLHPARYAWREISYAGILRHCFTMALECTLSSPSTAERSPD